VEEAVERAVVVERGGVEGAEELGGEFAAQSGDFDVDAAEGGGAGGIVGVFEGVAARVVGEGGGAVRGERERAGAGALQKRVQVEREGVRGEVFGGDGDVYRAGEDDVGGAGVDEDVARAVGGDGEAQLAGAVVERAGEDEFARRAVARGDDAAVDERAAGEVEHAAAGERAGVAERGRGEARGGGRGGVAGEMKRAAGGDDGRGGERDVRTGGDDGGVERDGRAGGDGSGAGERAAVEDEGRTGADASAVLQQDGAAGGEREAARERGAVNGERGAAGEGRRGEDVGVGGGGDDGAAGERGTGEVHAAGGRGQPVRADVQRGAGGEGRAGFKRGAVDEQRGAGGDGQRGRGGDARAVKQRECALADLDAALEVERGRGKHGGAGAGLVERAGRGRDVRVDAPLDGAAGEQRVAVTGDGQVAHGDWTAVGAGDGDGERAAGGRGEERLVVRREGARDAVAVDDLEGVGLVRPHPAAAERPLVHAVVDGVVAREQFDGGDVEHVVADAVAVHVHERNVVRGRERVDGVEEVETGGGGDLAEDGEAAVLRVEVLAVVADADEPLARRAVGVGGNGVAVRVSIFAEFRHRDGAADVRQVELVDDVSVVADVLQAVRAERVSAALHDEARHTAVENRSEIVGRIGAGGLDVFEEVRDRQRRHVAEEPDVHLTDCRASVGNGDSHRVLHDRRARRRRKGGEGDGRDVAGSERKRRRCKQQRARKAKARAARGTRVVGHLCGKDI